MVGVGVLLGFIDCFVFEGLSCLAGWGVGCLRGYSERGLDTDSGGVVGLRT